MSISQEAHYRQVYLEYNAKHGNVMQTCKRYRISRKTFYKWHKVWDGKETSLEDRSRAPHRMPKKMTEQQVRLVRRLCKKYKWRDTILAYQEAIEKHGFTRSYHCFQQRKRKLQNAKPLKEKKKRRNKPYERAAYPGQKVQIDVKYVPTDSLTGAAQQEKYYVYVAVDECTRWTYRQMYNEHSTHSSKQFLEELLQKAPFQIRMIQTDNGTEFTKKLLTRNEEAETEFERLMEEYGIIYHRIKPGTPRHNGKVERTNRIDQERFYDDLRMFSYEDGKKQLAVYQSKYNDWIKHCLGMRSPNQVLEAYEGIF